MARVTVEDCVVKVPNRFNLVMYAAQRARDISAGMPLTLDRDNDKNPVVALREIADETVALEEVEESLIKSLQAHVEMDEPEDDDVDLLAIQQELTSEMGGEPTSEDIANAFEATDGAAVVDAGGEVFADVTPEDLEADAAQG